MHNGMMELQQKNIWVIGGAGYLGQATVKLLNSYNANVLCIDVENRAQDFINTAGLEKNVTAAAFDINNTGAIPGFVKEQAALHGLPHGLVNLTFGSTSKKLEDLLDEDFDKVNHTALTATFILCRETVSYMIPGSTLGEGQSEV